MANQVPVKESIVLLFHRPCDPLFAPKHNGTVTFDVPPHFHTDRYKSISTAISSRFGKNANIERIVSLRSDIELPNLEFTEPIKIQASFSLFNTKHQQIAGQLIRIFMNVSDLDTLLSTAAYCRDRVNPHLFSVLILIFLNHKIIIIIDYFIIVFFLFLKSTP